MEDKEEGLVVTATGTVEPKNTVHETVESRWNAASDGWKSAISAFAKRIGRTPEDVTGVLLNNAVDIPDDANLEIVGDPESVTEEDFKRYFPNAKGPTLRAAIRDLRNAVGMKVVPTTAPVTPEPVKNTVPGFNISASVLPRLPATDDGFLSDLTTGGKLNKIRREDVAAAMRVYLAEKAGIYGARQKIRSLVEQFSERQDAPADDVVYEVIADIERENYGDALKAFGVKSDVVTKTRRADFVARIEQNLIPALYAFNEAMNGWVNAWNNQTANPAAIMGMLGAAFSGGGAAALQGIQTPDVSPLRSASSALTDAANKTFRGLYVVAVGAAMATDAVNILKKINDPRVLQATGLASRDDLIRALDISVTDQMKRAERELADYVYGALYLENLSDDEVKGAAFALQNKGQSVFPALMSLDSSSKKKGNQRDGGPNFAPRPRPFGDKTNTTDSPYDR